MRPASGIRLLCLALLLLAFGSRAEAAEFDRGELRLDLRSHLRSLFTFTRQLDPDRLFLEGSTRKRDAGLWLLRGRVIAEAAWRDRLSGQVIYDNEVRTGSALRALPFQVGKTAGTDTWLDADRFISDHRDGNWRHLLYRAWVRYEDDRVDLTVGRQRIPLGRARLWNPADLFNPIPPLAIEGDQRIGQDAVRLRLRLARGLWTEAIYSPQDDPDESRAAIRLELGRTALDAAGMIGRIERDWVFGADFAANLGDAAVRGEATFTDLDAGGRIWQVVGSIDYTFDVGSGLYALAEHLYNENLVDPAAALELPPPPSVEAGLRALARFSEEARNRITTFARHQTGFQLAYDVNPLLRANLLWIYDWNGPSAAFFPTLSYALRPDLEVGIGAQLFLGPRGRSEYGDRSPLVLLQVDAFF